MSAENITPSRHQRIAEIWERLKAAMIAFETLESQNRQFPPLKSFVGWSAGQLEQAAHQPFGLIGPKHIPIVVRMQELNREIVAEKEALLHEGIRPEDIGERCEKMLAAHWKAERRLLPVPEDEYGTATAPITTTRDKPTEHKLAKAEKDRKEMDRILAGPVPNGIDKYFGRLTEKERDIAILLSRGWNVSRIARANGKHTSTIQEAVERIKSKTESEQSRTIKGRPNGLEDDIIAEIDREKDESNRRTPK